MHLRDNILITSSGTPREMAVFTAPLRKLNPEQLDGRELAERRIDFSVDDNLCLDKGLPSRYRNKGPDSEPRTFK